MSRYEHGRVLAVNEERLGSELVADHPAGSTALTVQDAADFDEDGGWLSVNDQVVEYTGVDDDTGTIALATATTALGEEGDRVWLWDELRSVVTTDKVAQVELDGDKDNADPLEATIPLHLLDDLDEGIRGSRGESVLLELDGDEWRIVDVLGLVEAGGLRFEANDSYVLTAADVTAGTATLLLSHEPVSESVVGIWAGVAQAPTEYAVDADARTVTWPLDDFTRAGDRLWVHYAYRRGSTASHISDPTFVGWTGQNNAQSSIALPAGAEPGDLMVLGMSDTRNQPMPTCTDGRMAPLWLPLNGRQGYWVGTYDGGGPVAVSHTDNGCSGLAVFRDCSVASMQTVEWYEVEGGGYYADTTLPQVSGSAFTFVVAQALTEIVSGEVVTPLAGWTTAGSADDVHTSIAAFWRKPSAPETSPASSLSFSGSQVWASAVVVKGG